MTLLMFRERKLPSGGRPASSTSVVEMHPRLPARPGGLEDATLAAYLAEFHDQGRSPGERLDGGGRAACAARPCEERRASVTF